MKKLVIGLIVLAVSAASFAILTDSGNIAASVAATTDISTPPTYPTAAAGTPVSEGVGCTNIVVVNQIGITDNSQQGWSLTVRQNVVGGDSLKHATSITTIPYSLQINNVNAGLGTGLTMAPEVDTDLSFTTNESVIACTGTATTATTDYTFDLRMTIAAGVMTDKLAGIYEETLLLTLVSLGL
jgi:hypothetical protein